MNNVILVSHETLWEHRQELIDWLVSLPKMDNGEDAFFFTKSIPAAIHFSREDDASAYLLRFGK